MKKVVNELQKVEKVEEVKMKGGKGLKIKDLSKLFNCSEGVLRKSLDCWQLNDIVNEENRINNLRRYLINKFGVQKCNELLGFDINELELIIGKRNTQNNYIEISDLKVNNDYTIRNYHFETYVTFVGVVEVNKIKLWIFKSSKNYIAKTFDELNNGHCKIMEEE